MPEFSDPEVLPWLLAAGAVFGLLWGSFLNVCIYRVVRDMSVATPRSFCPACETPIAWHDNLPLLSYIWLRGKCRQCQSPIGVRYPLVELTTAILFACVIWRFGWTLATLKWSVFESLMIVLFCTDIDIQILPDEFTLCGIAAGAIFAWLSPIPTIIFAVFLPDSNNHVQSLITAVVGSAALPLPLWLFAYLYKRMRRLDNDPLGFGDVKLMALIGVFFGVERAIPAFIVATVAGALAGGIYVVLKGRSAWRFELPFGAFLCATAALAIFTGNQGA